MGQTTGSSHIAFTMAGVLAAGGLTGYLRAKSLASLNGGLGFASLFVVAGVLINRGEGKLGHGLAFGSSAALLSTMGPRFLRTKKVMPSGILALCGLLSSAYEGQKTLEWMD